MLYLRRPKSSLDMFSIYSPRCSSKFFALFYLLKRFCKEASQSCRCLHPGKRIPFGNGFTRIYSGDVGDPRTLELHTRDAINADLNKNDVHNGVKGTSLLMGLSIFNIIKGFPPEYMHCILLGVVKLFLMAWVTSQNSGKRWYIGAKLRILDQRISTILPPCEVTRVPQSLENLKQWKAIEFKDFVLYYSLCCLKDILPRNYFKHWSLLVYAMHIFNSDSFTKSDHEKATSAIRKFVFDTENLYGQEFMKFNVHLLLHIPESVKNFGALWAWSAFPYENYNFVLRNMLHSSQAVLHQICKSYLRFQSVKHMDSFEKENCNPFGKKVFLKLRKKYRTRGGMQVQNTSALIIYGYGQPEALSMVEKLSIERILGEPISEVGVSFKRFLYENELYHSSTYEKMYKRNNSVIEINSETILEISKIIRVEILNSTERYVIMGKEMDIVPNKELCRAYNISSSKYSRAVERTENIVTCFPEEISRKCIYITCVEDSYVIQLVNKMETE